MPFKMFDCIRVYNFSDFIYILHSIPNFFGIGFEAIVPAQPNSVGADLPFL